MSLSWRPQAQSFGKHLLEKFDGPGIETRFEGLPCQLDVAIDSVRSPGQFVQYDDSEPEDIENQRLKKNTPIKRRLSLNKFRFPRFF